MVDDGSCVLSGPNTHLVGNTVEIDCSSEGRRLEAEAEGQVSEAGGSLSTPYESAKREGAREMYVMVQGFLQRETQDPMLLEKLKQLFGRPASP